MNNSTEDDVSVVEVDEGDAFPEDQKDEFTQKAESIKYIARLENKIRVIKEKGSHVGRLYEQRNVDKFSGSETIRTENEEEEEKDNESLIQQPDELIEEEEQEHADLPPRGIMKRFYDLDDGELHSDFVSKGVNDEQLQVSHESDESDDDDDEEDHGEADQLNDEYANLALEDEEEEHAENQSDSDQQQNFPDAEFEVNFDEEFNDS